MRLLLAALVLSSTSLLPANALDQDGYREYRSEIRHAREVRHEAFREAARERVRARFEMQRERHEVRREMARLRREMIRDFRQQQRDFRRDMRHVY
jgi:hypothetical protein